MNNIPQELIDDDNFTSSNCNIQKEYDMDDRQELIQEALEVLEEIENTLKDIDTIIEKHKNRIKRSRNRKGIRNPNLYLV